MRGRLARPLAAPDTRKSVFRDSPILFTKVGKIKCLKKKVPNLYPITHSSSQLFWTEQPPRSGPPGDPLCLQGPPADTLLNPRPAGSVLARLKYYLAQASRRGTPKLPMGPAPAGLHSQEAQKCPNTGRHLAPPPYCQGPDSLSTTYLSQTTYFVLTGSPAT